MKVLFCFFSYANDLPLLRRALDSVGRLRALYPEHELLAAVVNDSNAPIAEEEMPEVELTRVTSWKRGLHLTELENIYGQLDTYAELCTATGADVLVKMDSDTMMTRLDWLEPFADSNRAVDMYGTCIYRRLSHICGYFYALTPRAALAMQALAADEGLRARIDASPEGWVLEDRIFTRLGQMAHARGLMGDVMIQNGDLHRTAELLREGQSAPTIGTQWLPEHEVPMERYADQVAVTFKRVGKSADVVQEALGGMDAFWAVIKDTPRDEPRQGIGLTPVPHDTTPWHRRLRYA